MRPWTSPRCLASPYSAPQRKKDGPAGRDPELERNQLGIVRNTPASPERRGDLALLVNSHKRLNCQMPASGGEAEGGANTIPMVFTTDVRRAVLSCVLAGGGPSTAARTGRGESTPRQCAGSVNQLSLQAAAADKNTAAAPSGPRAEEPPTLNLSHFPATLRSAGRQTQQL